MFQRIGLLLVVALSLGSSHVVLADPSPDEAVGDAVSKRISVDWGPMPQDWVRDRNVMDPIWASLGYAGVNYYAFGGPVASNPFASRSDPGSANHQAWFGVYVVVPAAGKVADPTLGINRAVSLAEHAAVMA